MAAQSDKNLFASPWNDSDLVLVVEEQELNVHRWVLTSQSPVFKAMLEGNFREASQDRITLEEKDYKSMAQFLKILYPSYMFEEGKSSLNDANLLPILALADEYQCINLIKHCIDEAKITPGNVLQLLPYAIKYREPALPKMFDVLKWGVPTAKLKKLLPKLDDKDESASIKMLLTKCHCLESSVVDLQPALISLMYEFLKQKKEKDNLSRRNEELQKKIESLEKKDAKPNYGFSYGLSSGWCSRSGNRFPASTKLKCSPCGRTISVEDVGSTKSCVHCMEKYKEKFITPIPSIYTKDYFFKILRDGQDIVNAVKHS